MKTIYIGFLSALFLSLVINAHAQIPATRSSLDTNRHPVRNTNDRNTNEVMVFASDTYDLSTAPLATPAEINQLNNIIQNQKGVGVLGGDNNKPFFYHTDQPSKPYIYKKLMDASRLPSGLIDHIDGHWYSIVLGDPLSLLISKYSIEGSDELKDWLVGRAATVKWVDCWYPIQNKQTLCGQVISNSFICGQDYLHTELTQDRDVNIRIIPGIEFRGLLDNPWLNPKEKEEVADTIEAEVRATHLMAYNTEANKSVETLTPHNPLLLQIRQNANICVYGPWMADKLDIEGVGPDINFNNEIHPVNQLWYKNGAETQLIAIADGTGYFDITGNNEIEASGLNHAMRFYIAFHIPAHFKPHHNSIGLPYAEYDINGIGFDLTDNPDNDIQTQVISLKNHDEVRMKINDNSFVKLQKTHNIFFDKIRTRPDGSFQGYIVVETVPIVKRGGSINISVVNKTAQSGDLEPTNPAIMH
jgi:hypothetical protein